jgi:hypothetical protein
MTDLAVDIPAVGRTLDTVERAGDDPSEKVLDFVRATPSDSNRRPVITNG